MQTITAHWVKGAKSLGFVISSAIKNVNQEFGVNIVPPVCNFTKNKTCNVFSCEFWEIFQPATFLKIRFRHNCFFGNFVDFFSLNFAKNETPAQVFSCKF